MKQPDHIQYIIDNYSTELQSRLREEAREITVEDTMDILMACDPSQGKKLTDWLVKTYVGGGFRWEDVEIGAESKLAEVLGMYQTYFSQIPREQRNIYTYQSYGELYTLLKPYLPTEKIEETLGSREIRRRERARALEESEVLYRSQDMIVTVPLTEEASKWWGRGTKWCTAAENNNQFNHYNQNAPLIVITLMNQELDSSINQSSDSTRVDTEKFQLWIDGQDVQFMDAQDSQVQTETIEKYWQWLKPIFILELEKRGEFLRFIPERYRTPKMYEQAINLNGLTIAYILKKQRTAEISQLAVKKDARALRYVPEHHKTYELCAMAIEVCGEILQDIPHEYRTLEICGKAVEQCGMALDYVPREYKTNEIVLKALKQNGSAIRYVPVELLTAEFCRIAVKSAGLMLANIATRFRVTDELCRLAVTNNGRALEYVPTKMKTVEICKLAINQSGLAIKYATRDIIDYELCSIAVKQNGEAFDFLPYQFKTAEMARLAVEQDGTSIFCMPIELRTTKLCIAAVEQNVDAFFYIPENKLNAEIYRLAVEKKSELIKFVPKDYLTDELKELANNIKQEIETNWDKSMLTDLKNVLTKHFEDIDQATSLNTIHP